MFFLENIVFVKKIKKNINQKTMFYPTKKSLEKNSIKVQNITIKSVQKTTALRKLTS